MAIEKLTNQFVRYTTTMPGYSYVYVLRDYTLFRSTTQLQLNLLINFLISKRLLIPCSLSYEENNGIFTLHKQYFSNRNEPKLWLNACQINLTVPLPIMYTLDSTYYCIHGILLLPRKHPTTGLLDVPFIWTPSTVTVGVTVNERSSQRSLLRDVKTYLVPLTHSDTTVSDDPTDFASTQKLRSVVNGLFQEILIPYSETIVSSSRSISMNETINIVMILLCT